MSDYKPEILPSGVLMRKIKAQDEDFILSNIDQAIIVTNLDIASMYGLAYPEKPIDAEQAWHDVEQKLTVQDVPEHISVYDAEVCKIAEILAMIEYKKCKWTLMTWDQLIEAAANPEYDFTDTHYKAQKEGLIHDKMEEARAMVAEMAKIYQLGHHDGYQQGVDRNGNNVKTIKGQMIERGLIPTSAQEGGEDVERT